jgi:lambda repressor-like predicted transcriptional regulator
MPDFKTIAHFRKDNSKAIRGVCRQFVVLCQQLGLFGENLVAIDGSKFKAVNNRGRNFTSAKLKRRMEEIESSMSRYLTVLDAADRQEPTASEPNAMRLEEKISKLKTQMKELQAIETQLNESPDKQASLTDPDARSMMTRGIGVVGYNVQTAVETQHHMIVVHEMANVGSAHDQLSSMAKQAREAMASDTLSVVADRGYFKSEQILACHDAGITAYVPKPVTSGAKADGRLNNDGFLYDAAKNEYICPAGEALIWRFFSVEKGLKLHRYWSSNCQECVLKSKCAPSKQRRVRRWEHEAVLEEMQNRLSNAPDMMRVRERTV